MARYEDRMDLVRSLVEEGLTKKEIAERSGIPAGSMSYFLRKWELEVARSRSKYDELRPEIEKMAKSMSSSQISEELDIPLSTVDYLKERWGLKGERRTGRHDHKRANAERMLDEDKSITEIAESLDIPQGSMGYLIAKWGLVDKQIRSRGIYLTDEGRESISKKASERHERLGYMEGESHPMYGICKVHREWIPKSELKEILEELIEQDLTYEQINEELETTSARNWIREFGLQRGIRSGSRCSWWRGGHESYRGPGWLAIRKQALERDGYKCAKCGLTQDGAYERDHALSVHHIVPYAGTQDNSMSNLITLCQSCHLEEEWKSGRLS